MSRQISTSTSVMNDTNISDPEIIRNCTTSGTNPLQPEMSSKLKYFFLTIKSECLRETFMRLK